MDDLLVEFLEEALESLSGLQAALVRLAVWPPKGTSSAASLGDAVARLHGLKGACGFLGLPRAEALAHAGESLVLALDGRAQVSPDAVALLGRTLDRLHELIAAAVAEGVEPAGADADLTAPLEHLAETLAHRPPGPVMLPPPDEAATMALDGGTVSASEICRGLPIYARLVGERLGKPVGLTVEGGSALALRASGPALRAALIALIRNACDHGIETAEERAAAGKPAQAHLRLSARAAKGSIRFTLADDGRGVPRALRRRMFEPGFSTATALSLLSGRGMGLSLVRSEMIRLGGEVRFASTAGRGAAFTLILPAPSASAELRSAA